jgi:hypothetical protein
MPGLGQPGQGRRVRSNKNIEKLGCGGANSELTGEQKES